jgi:hypothetical protein
LRGRGVYSDRVVENAATTLSKLTGAHSALLEHCRRVESPSVDVALSLGAAVRIHQVMVELIPEPLRSLTDEGIAAELGLEERSLAENLDYLGSLSEAEPDSPDVSELAAALVERMRQHLERSHRALFGPLEHLSRKDT